MTKNRILYVVIRDRTGGVMHQAIGSAILEADSDASLTTLALRAGIEPLATFGDYSPAEAEDAKQTLAELGDVEFNDADFEPHWHEPASCINAIDGLIGLGRKASRFLSSDVRSELAFLRGTLEKASHVTSTLWMWDLERGLTSPAIPCRRGPDNMRVNPQGRAGGTVPSSVPPHRPPRVSVGVRRTRAVERWRDGGKP